MQELNKLDNLRTQMMLRVERKCQEIKTGEVPYSPDDVQRYGKEIRLWSMILHKKIGKQVSTRLIAQCAHEIGIHGYMHHSIESIRKLRSTVWKSYRDAKPTARNTQSTFVLQQASLRKE